MLNNINLTWEQVFSKGGYLAGVRERHSYKDGKKQDEIEGINYIVASRSGFDKVTIKTNDKVPKMTQEELEASDKDVKVVAKGFVGRLYTTPNGTGISATAEEVILS